MSEAVEDAITGRDRRSSLCPGKALTCLSNLGIRSRLQGSQTEWGDTNLLHYIDGLYGYAMLLTRDATEAEDLVQETYFCAIPRVASLRVGSNLKSWLLAILRNIWLEQLRCGGVAPKIVAFEMYETIADTIIETSEYLHASDVSQLEHDRMRVAIQRLPVEFREIILLRESKSCPLGKSPRS